MSNPYEGLTVLHKAYKAEMESTARWHEAYVEEMQRASIRQAGIKGAVDLYMRGVCDVEDLERRIGIVLEAEAPSHETSHGSPGAAS